MSGPLSASQAVRYHAADFGPDAEVKPQWYGELAEQWGLTGDASIEAFRRAAEGQHPVTGEPLIQHQKAGARRMAHRAGWDVTFSAPKSVSVTATVGGDARVQEAHQRAVAYALGVVIQPRVMAHLGGSRRAETTGNAVAVVFQHDRARPVQGYAAPQVHTHVLVFNMTQTANRDIRPLETRELFKAQRRATAIYREALSARLTELGYRVERGPKGEPVIAGYTPEYLTAMSPRRAQIVQHLRDVGREGPGAAQVAAHRTREPKGTLTPQQTQLWHQAWAARYGHQPQRVVANARARVPEARTVILTPRQSAVFLAAAGASAPKPSRQPQARLAVGGVSKGGVGGGGCTCTAPSTCTCPLRMQRDMTAQRRPEVSA